MNSWWKKALLLTAAWAVLAVGVGSVLAVNASSQYAADRITVWIVPLFALGTLVVWIAAFKAQKKR